jgi:hypothetical protein
LYINLPDEIYENPGASFNWLFTLAVTALRSNKRWHDLTGYLYNREILDNSLIIKYWTEMHVKKKQYYTYLPLARSFLLLNHVRN